ncbi:MAG: HPr family phosphocarrier protein [Actinomycetota bacterium]|jgi:phosphocarrier protein|nr:HPr family phosphocarrier protein [Actinomycetota bacterium]MDQ2697959.1 HPr family phosphocarrier protein [Actinomycetota bacterium]
MPTRATAVVASRIGLHARPVSVFTRAVRATGISVTIARPGEEGVNAASPLLVMSLGVAHGDEVVLESDAADADAHLNDLARLLESELDA